MFSNKTTDQLPEHCIRGTEQLNIFKHIIEKSHIRWNIYNQNKQTRWFWILELETELHQVLKGGSVGLILDFFKELFVTRTSYSSIFRSQHNLASDLFMYTSSTSNGLYYGPFKSQFFLI